MLYLIAYCTVSSLLTWGTLRLANYQIVGNWLTKFGMFAALVILYPFILLAMMTYWSWVLYHNARAALKGW